jgi:hypothetical protein
VDETRTHITVAHCWELPESKCSSGWIGENNPTPRWNPDFEIVLCSASDAISVFATNFITQELIH